MFTKNSSRCLQTLLPIWCVVLSAVPGDVIAAPQTSASLQLGYRLDNLDWNIADGDGSPNVLSELEWRDMDIMQLKAEVSGSNYSQIYIRSSAAAGWAIDGENQDSDYAGDNRSLEFSRSINSVNGSRMLDLSAGVGYEFYFGAQAQHSLIPIIGYAINYQFLQVRNGNQVIPDTGSFSGLDTSYDARWWGPWLGMDMLLNFGNSGSAFARFEYHIIDYYAEANWNLRTDLAHPVSFKHSAEGDGVLLEFGWRQEIFKDEWTWGLTGAIQSWGTEAGNDRVYGAGCGGCYADTRLNEVNWTSKSINLTLNKQF